jgi:hypothetical protein
MSNNHPLKGAGKGVFLLVLEMNGTGGSFISKLGCSPILYFACMSHSKSFVGF